MVKPSEVVDGSARGGEAGKESWISSRFGGWAT